jgi:hypothetical protein
MHAGRCQSTYLFKELLLLCLQNRSLHAPRVLRYSREKKEAHQATLVRCIELHVVFSVPACLMEGYRESLLTIQSAEARVRSCLLRQAGKLGGVGFEVDEVDGRQPALPSFVLAPFAFGAHLLIFFTSTPRHIPPVAARGHTLPRFWLAAPSSTGTTVFSTQSTNSLDTFTNPQVLTCA